MNEERVDFSELTGEILTSVVEGEVPSGYSKGGFMLTFKTESGKEFRMYHDRDCCESVYLEDVCGSWSDIIGHEILMAEERTKDASKDLEELTMWTFYTIRTSRGTVDLRWLGQSNGYYSVGVSFYEVLKEKAD